MLILQPTNSLGGDYHLRGILGGTYPIHNMAKPQHTKTEVVSQPTAPKYSRFGHLAFNPTGHTFVRGLAGRPMRDETPPEREDAIVLHKANRHGWAQRTSCGQRWVAYCPYHPNDFRAKEAKTLKEALRILCGWLGFTNDETLKQLS